MSDIVRTYEALISYREFEERLGYLSLRGIPGVETFGSLRGINQAFYRSTEWRRIRALVINRDNGCDLGVPGCEIMGKIIVHHMNPITPHTLQHNVELALSPSFLISTSNRTHQEIHYGVRMFREKDERRPGDTKLW